MRYTVELFNVVDMRPIRAARLNRGDRYTENCVVGGCFTKTKTHCAWTSLSRAQTMWLLDKLVGEVVITDEGGRQSYSMKNHVGEFNREFPDEDNVVMREYSLT